MKNFVLLLLFCFVGILCSSSAYQKDADNQPNNSASDFLIGKWQLDHFEYQFTKQSGEVKTSLSELKKNGNTIIWTFYADGRMVSQSENMAPVESRWDFQVTKTNGTAIENGKLILTGAYAEEMKAVLQLDELAYDIKSNSSGTIIDLAVDASKTSEVYKSVQITYTYLKI